MMRLQRHRHHYSGDGRGSGSPPPPAPSRTPPAPLEMEPRREATPVRSDSRPRTPEVVRPEVVSRERELERERERNSPEVIRQRHLSLAEADLRMRRRDESPPLPPRITSHLERERVRSVSPVSGFQPREHLSVKRDILDRHHPHHQHHHHHSTEEARLSVRDASPRPHHSPGTPSRAVSPAVPLESPRKDRPLSGGGAGGKDSLTPPNVTVIQPSVSHPMFSYLYHPAASMYASGSPHSLPLSMGHMLFNSGVTPPGSLPFAVPSTLAAELGHLQGSAAIAAQAAAGLHPMLNGQLQALAGHHQALWAAAQNYPGASHGAFSHTSSEGSPSAGSSTGHLPGTHHLTPIFAPRATHRFSPYSLPLTKTTMATTSAPLVATGGGGVSSSSPVRSQSEHSVTSPGRSRGVPSPTPHSPSRGSPGATPTHQSNTSSSQQATSELKNIERMVNGLERQQEQLAVDSISKLEK